MDEDGLYPWQIVPMECNSRQSRRELDEANDKWHKHRTRQYQNLNPARSSERGYPKGRTAHARKIGFRKGQS